MRTINRSRAGRLLLLPLTASLLLSGTASARLPEPNHLFYGTAMRNGVALSDGRGRGAARGEPRRPRASSCSAPTRRSGTATFCAFPIDAVDPRDPGHGPARRRRAVLRRRGAGRNGDRGRARRGPDASTSIRRMAACRRCRSATSRLYEGNSRDDRLRLHGDDVGGDRPGRDLQLGHGGRARRPRASTTSASRRRRSATVQAGNTTDHPDGYSSTARPSRRTTRPSWSTCRTSAPTRRSSTARRSAPSSTTTGRRRSRSPTSRCSRATPEPSRRSSSSPRRGRSRRR